jgi:hypothetical protein
MIIKPREIKKPKYWFHIAVNAFLYLLILQLLFRGDMLTLKNVLISIPIIAVTDIISHSILRLD